MKRFFIRACVFGFGLWAQPGHLEAPDVIQEALKLGQGAREHRAEAQLDLRRVNPAAVDVLRGHLPVAGSGSDTATATAKGTGKRIAR